MTSLGYGTMAPWHRTRMVPHRSHSDLRIFIHVDSPFKMVAMYIRVDPKTPIIGLVFLGSNRNPLYVMEKTHGFWSFRWRFSKENQLSDDTGSFAKPKNHQLGRLLLQELTSTFISPRILTTIGLYITHCNINQDVMCRSPPVSDTLIGFILR